MTDTNIDLSIIIPAYKEGDLLSDSLDKLSAFLQQRNYLVEVVVVVAQSPDQTLAIANNKAKLFPYFKAIDAGERGGKGRDVRIGMFEASGRYKLFMDADLATPLHHIDEVFEHMKHDAKVIIAVRDLVKIHKGLLRKVVTRVANIGAQVILVPGIKDTQCGFKAFEATAAQEIFSRQTILGWSFDVEILKIARLLGYKIDFIEASDWKDPKKVGLVGDSPFKIVIQEATVLFKIRLNVWLGKYKQKTFTYKSPE
jgi:dolichyl-phosphate beta-glucosyltransferase